jgi:hypothetical protein
LSPRVILAISALAAVAMYPTPPASAQDDWHVVERHTHATSPDASDESQQAPAQAQSGDAKTFTVCGESARAATEPYTSIVNELDSMWSTRIKVYESVAQMSPHAVTGGCIFYNQKYLTMLMGDWMNMRDADAVNPMLYAIFAHEMGHVIHGDVNPELKGVPQKDKELAADHIAGYSLQRIGIRRLDPAEITRYYQLTGDDFTGGGGGHGNGGERAAAFQDGWHRAEMGLPETGGRPAGGFDAP